MATPVLTAPESLLLLVYLMTETSPMFLQSTVNTLICTMFQFLPKLFLTNVLRGHFFFSKRYSTVYLSGHCSSALGGGCRDGLEGGEVPPPPLGVPSLCPAMVSPWGALLFSSVHQPPRRGQGGDPEGGGMGGGQKIFPNLGAFLSSPFHSEHYEYTQVG